MKANILDVKNEMAEKLNMHPLDESRELKSLGLDSLDVVELCLDLEDKYEVNFSTDELASFVTIGDMLKAIEKKLG